MEDFDRILLETIVETFNDSIGEANTQIIFQYFENRSCPMRDIPKRLAFFDSELRKIFGFGRGMMLGSTVILEQAITEKFCRKIGSKHSGMGPFAFASFIERLREEYAKGKRVCTI